MVSLTMFRTAHAKGLTWALIVGLMVGWTPMAMAGPGSKNKTSKKPEISLKAKVTSRAQLGELENNVLILCPKTTHTIDLSRVIKSRFKARAKSADARIASVKVARNRQNHSIVTIQAGDNNTDRDKITTITIQTKLEILQTGIPQAPGKGTQDKGHGIHGSGKDSKPKQINLGANQVRTGKIMVRVLAAKKCALLPKEPPKKKKYFTTGGNAGSKTVKPRKVTICDGGARKFKLQSDIGIYARYAYRNKAVGGQVPLIQNLVFKNSNPVVAHPVALGHLDGNNKRTGKGIILLIFGKEVGTTTISFEEMPTPSGVPPLKDTFIVTVKECSTDKIDAQLNANTYLKGYYPIPAPKPEPKDDLIDELDKELEELDKLRDQVDKELEQEDDGKSNGSSIPKSVKPQDNRHSSVLPQDFDETHHAMVALTAQNGDVELAVFCPSDTQAGDVISCSVFSDGQPATHYSVQVTSTATFTDDDDAPTDDSRVAVGDQDEESQTTVGQNGLASILIPQAISSAMIAIRDAAGDVVCAGNLPVAPEGASASEATFALPSQTVAQQPIAMTGPFDSPVSDSAVSVGGQPAQVLVKSPRSLVVSNPAEIPGPAFLVLSEGPMDVHHTVENLPPQRFDLTPHPALSTSGAGGVSTQSPKQPQPNPQSPKSPQNGGNPGPSPPGPEPGQLPQPPQGGGWNGDTSFPSPVYNTTGVPGPATPMSAACQETVATYRQHLKQMVDAGWRGVKPPSKGVWTAKLSYELMPNGAVGNIRVMQPSGYPAIDQSAIQRVMQMQGQFPPLPPCFTEDSMEVDHTFQVIYR